MASFVYAVWSITNVASVHCAVRPEISPCTCEPVYAHNYVELSCEKVDSFHKIVDALSNKFEPNISISLKISHSQLDDLEMRSFTDMNLNVVKLRLQWNGLRSVPELPFRGLSNVEFLSVGDNELEEIPKHVLNHLPIIKTLDMGRGHIRSVLQDDLKGIQMVTNLFLPSNNITRLDAGSFPPGLVTLHLGRNQIEHLNGTLRDLNKLESLFINMNNIQTLDNELPESHRLKLILAQNNRLARLPASMKHMNKLETLHLQNNILRSFDGVFKHAKNLNLLHAFSNRLEYLANDEFAECEYLEELNLSYNHIKTLNYSLLPLRRLFVANFSFNDIDEFSMNEIRGLKHLKQLDMSHNRIVKLSGHQENNIDQQSFLIEFNLDYNDLRSLDGALMGLNRLRTLTLSHNRIERILPDDFIGLEKIEVLELSHNHLLTLKEMETTFLPNLKVLKVAYNNLTILEKDFHGLPVLCQANLTNNLISSISTDLVSETRCMNHNVPGKLELHLENNPIMCNERLNKLCPMMLAQEARIRGKSHCYNSDLEVCADLPLIFTQNLTIIIQQLNHQAGAVVAPMAKPMIQLIVPSPIVLNNNKLKKTDDLLPPIIAPLGQPIIKPLILATTVPTMPSPPPPPPLSPPLPPSPPSPSSPSQLSLPSLSLPSVILSLPLSPTPPSSPAASPPPASSPSTTMATTTIAATTTTTTALPSIHENEMKKNIETENQIATNINRTDGLTTTTTTTTTVAAEATATAIATTTTTTSTTAKPNTMDFSLENAPVVLDIETDEMPILMSPPLPSSSSSSSSSMERIDSTKINAALIMKGDSSSSVKDNGNGNDNDNDNDNDNNNDNDNDNINDNNNGNGNANANVNANANANANGNVSSNNESDNIGAKFDVGLGIVGSGSSSNIGQQTDYPTMEYIPNVDPFVAANHPLDVFDEDTNNSVHEEFASVVLTDLDNGQQGPLIPGEPPEIGGP